MAPGNGSRSGVYPDIPSRHNLEFALVETSRQTVRFIIRFGSYPAMWVVAFAAWWWGRSLLPPALRTSAGRASTVAALVGPAALIYLTLFPVYWEYGEVNFTGEGRTYNVTFVALCALVVTTVWLASSRLSGVVTSLGAPRQAARGTDLALALALAVLVVATPSTRRVGEALRTAPRYLEEEQARAAILRSSPPTGVIFVDAISVRPQGLFWGDIQPDPSHWINACTARYFGLEAVRTRM
jgi:hypothetical protein